MLLKNTPKKQLGFRAFSNSAPKLWNALPQTIREADSSATFRRRLKYLFFDWLSFSVSAWLTVHHNFSMSSQDCFYDSIWFFFWKKISFRALIIQVNGTNRYRNGYHHHHHHYCYGYSQRKKKKTSTLLAILTIGLLWQKKTHTKTTNMLHHAGKRDTKIQLEKQLPFRVMCCYSWSCDTRTRGLRVETREIA